MSTIDSSGISFANRLCDILQIENKNILKIKIVIAPRDLVEITIHRAMTNNEGTDILTEIQKMIYNGEEELSEERKKYLKDNDFDDRIDEWHSIKAPTLSLHEFLGLTLNEYKYWLKHW